MAYAKATLIKRVRQLTGDDPWETYITAASGTDNVIPVADGTDWEEGDVGEFQDNGEQFLVRSIATNDLTVKRSHKGTLAAIDHPSDTVVFKHPTFSYIDIEDGIKGTINTLWPYAWKATSNSINVDNTTEWYAVNQATIDLIKVAQPPIGGLTGAMRYYGSKDGYPVTFRTDHPTLGRAIRFPGGLHTIDNDVVVTARTLITAAVTPPNYDDITDELLAECIAYGTAARLVIAKEVPRVTQEDSRQPDVGVPPQARISAGQILNTMFVTLRHQYADYLRRTAPPMKTWDR